MSNPAVEIAEKLVEKADSSEIIFTKSDKTDNLLQLIYEQRVTVEEIGTEVQSMEDDALKKKILHFYASELIKYLHRKLQRNKATGFRGTPNPDAKEPAKKLSKSEQFLERKQKEKEAKERAKREKSKSDGQIEKLSLKDVGKELEAEMELQKEIDKKVKSAQEDVLAEQQKHKAAYQTAFEIYAYVVKNISGNGKDLAEISELIGKIGSTDITARQIALDKMQRNPNSVYAQEALIAGLKDRNLIINILPVLQNVGDKRSIVPLVSLIQEYPTAKDIIFRGPAERAIGDIVQRMNEKAKNSGTKYMYQLVSRPEFAKQLKLLLKVIGRDASNKKYKSDYLTQQCITWMSAIAEKLQESKKKKVKVAFVNMAMQTDESKELKDFIEALNS